MSKRTGDIDHDFRYSKSLDDQQNKREACHTGEGTSKRGYKIRGQTEYYVCSQK